MTFKARAHALILRLERNPKLAAAFRALRLAVVGAVTAVLTSGNPVTIVGVTAAAETAFRAAFPAAVRQVLAPVAPLAIAAAPSALPGTDGKP